MNNLDAPSRGAPPEGRAATLRIRTAVFGVFLACLLGSATAPAQGIDDPAYKVNAGDNLRVDVTGRPDLSVTVAVDDRGEVILPVIGAIRAGGRTTIELAADIARRISLVQRETPQVRVVVVESRSQRIFVLGSVLLPDAYTFPANTSVWDAIAAAGGSTSDANLSAVEITSAGAKPGQAPEIVDVDAAIRTGAYDALPRLKPGDTVRVPSKGYELVGEGSVVYIMGAVSAQGAHPLEPPADLLSTIIRSSPSADADLERVEIVRRSGERLVQMRVNARDYLSDARAAGNPVLRPGDTIYVPRERRGFGILSLIGTVSPVIGLITSVVVLAR